MNSFHRLLDIIREIDLRPGQTAQQLAEKYGCSLRTIQRDFKAIENLHLSLYNDKGYRFLSKPHLRPLALDRDEYVALSLACRVAERQLDFRMNDAVKRVFKKIHASLDDRAQESVRRITDGTAVTDPISELSHSDLFAKLTSAVEQQHLVSFRYRGRDAGEFTQRKVEPLGLFFQTGHWYLKAIDVAKVAERTFRLQRMEELHILEQKFTPREAFDANEAAFHEWDISENDPTRITFETSPKLARWFNENKPHPSIEVKDSIVTIKVRDTAAFLRWFVSLDNARLISPPECVQEVQDRLEQLTALYG